MEEKTKIILIKAIVGLIAFIVFAFVLWYMWASTHPAIAIIRMEMDNNTLEAVRLMNTTL